MMPRLVPVLVHVFLESVSFEIVFVKRKYNDTFDNVWGELRHRILDSLFLKENNGLVQIAAELRAH